MNERCVQIGSRLPLWLALLISACRSGTPSSSAEPPPAPVVMGALVLEPSKAVVTKLIQAHYDPESFGLRELTFILESTMAKHQIQLSADGRWIKGGHPSVTLRSVKRRGQPERIVLDGGEVDSQILKSIQLQLQNLLEGLGSGFLVQRLTGWSRLEGKTRLKGEKLELQLAEEGGEATVVVGQGYVVERVTHRSTKGVTRAMEYRSQLEGGRNLVTRTLFTIVVDPGIDLPPRFKKSADATDKSLTEISYGRAGRYLLPTRLHKVIPGMKEEIAISLHYLQVR